MKRNKYNTLIDLGGLVGAATVIYLVLKGLGYLYTLIKGIFV